jgi:hypothetical protein
MPNETALAIRRSRTAKYRFIVLGSQLYQLYAGRFNWSKVYRPNENRPEKPINGYILGL